MEIMPDLLVTGIPRSGTSFLTSLIHKVDNSVAINEPEEIFRYLEDERPPWGMAAYYGMLRARIATGSPITNKLYNGDVIEDTAVIDNEESYVPSISGPAFLLATKNTLGYLARLRFLAKALPGATFVACVRNPYFTIASWIQTFPHLREASPHNFRKGFAGDLLMRPVAQERLRAMADIAAPETRRALLWNHLAHLILEDKSIFATICRYEDLVESPAKILEEIFDKTPGSPPFKPRGIQHKAEPSTGRIGALSPSDFHTIRSICSEAAAAFGYSLDKPLGELE